MTSGGIRPASDGTDPDLVCRTDHQPTATPICSTCSAKKPLTEMARDRSTKTVKRWSFDERMIRACREAWSRKPCPPVAHQDAVRSGGRA